MHFRLSIFVILGKISFCGRLMLQKLIVKCWCTLYGKSNRSFLLGWCDMSTNAMFSGERASQCIFHAFMSLVIFIAVMKLLILFLYIYLCRWFFLSAVQGAASLLPSLSKVTAFQPHLPSSTLGLYWPTAQGEEAGFRRRTSHHWIWHWSEPHACADGRGIKATADCDFGVHGTRCPLRDFQRIADYLNWALTFSCCFNWDFVPYIQKLPGNSTKEHLSGLITMLRESLNGLLRRYRCTFMFHCVSAIAHHDTILIFTMSS